MNYVIKNLADLFNACADRVELHGLCKGRSSTQDGKVCAYGALDSVTANDPAVPYIFVKGYYGTSCQVDTRADLLDMKQEASDIMWKWAANNGYIGLTSWNDMNERTADQVARLFRRFAAGER